MYIYGDMEFITFILNLRMTVCAIENRLRNIFSLIGIIVEIY